MTAPLLEAKELVKQFRVGSALSFSNATVHALSGVSFEVIAGETLAIVGESGCGKTTLARCLVGLIEPTSGTLLVAGEDARDLLRRDSLQFHRLIQIVFQDPYASLNPRRTVSQSVGDGLRLHNICARGDRNGTVVHLLAQVGLSREHLDRYPHELSGGQRQRVAIARALAVGPRVLICDEPVSALDVSVQAQVINVFNRLQRELGVAYVFISHNLALVRHISQRIAVMYFGQIVEMGTTRELRRVLRHPYSQILFAATPQIGRKAAHRPPHALADEMPSPLAPPSGCRFRTRCPFARGRCGAEEPELREVDGVSVRCHFAEEVAKAPG